MSEANSNPPAAQSPPPMPQPAREPSDPRIELDQMTASLKQKTDRSTLSRFLRLRRAIRR